MEFCPKCGAMLSFDSKIKRCPRCGYSKREKSKIKLSEEIKEKSQVEVISGKEPQTLPIVEEKCKKCGNSNSYFWTIQTRAGDEAETKFFKCTKCSHTWRNYR